jgi:hypothetical protein
MHKIHHYEATRPSPPLLRRRARPPGISMPPRSPTSASTFTIPSVAPVAPIIVTARLAGSPATHGILHAPLARPLPCACVSSMSLASGGGPFEGAEPPLDRAFHRCMHRHANRLV